MKKRNFRSSFFALLALSFLLPRCTRNADDVISATEAALVRNTWSVGYYFNYQDMTNNYSSSKLLFSSTGSVGYEKDGEMVAGKWSRTVDASNNELITLQFTSSDVNIDGLNKSWKLVDRTTSSLQFEKSDGTTNILFELKTQ